MKGVNHFYFLMLLLIVWRSCYSQTSIWIDDSTEYYPPHPSIGWDSLESLIIYPEVYKRAGVEQSQSIVLFISSKGKIDSVNYGKLSSVFYHPIDTTFHSIIWIPGKSKGIPVDTSITIPIHFSLYDSENAPPINIISAKKITRGHWEYLPVFIDTTIIIIPDEKPDNFNFVFKWWTYRDSLYLNTSQKLLISREGDVDTSVSFTLSNNEIDSIYKVMRQIHFLCYPKDFKPGITGIMNPSFDFSCEMIVNDFKNEISIDTGLLSNDQSFKKLKDFYWLIYGIIHNSADFKKIRKSKMIYIYE